MLGPPGISSHPHDVTNDAESTASITVAAGGTQPLGFQWRKNGVVLADGGNISGGMTATLTVSSLLKSDEGGYSVVITNSQGSVTSLVATLTVIDPAVNGQPVSQIREPGQSVSFSVTAAGTAPLSYLWRKDSVSMSDGGSVWGATTRH